MYESIYRDDEDSTLVNTIRKLKQRANLSYSQDFNHAKFLLDVIEELEDQVKIERVAYH